MSEISYNAFSLTAVQDALHGPRHPIGSGKEHIVLNDPYFDQLAREGDPQAALVIKINLLSLREGNSGSREENIAMLSKWADERNARSTRLRSAFGQAAVPEEHSEVMGLWLDPADEALVWPKRPPSQTGKLYYAVVTRQDKVWELDSKAYDRNNVFPIHAAYPERLKPPPGVADYIAINHPLVTRATDTSPLQETDIAHFLALYPRLSGLTAAIRLIEPVHSGIREFTEKAIDYSNQTGEILDIMGTDNAIVTRDGRLRLVDVLIPKADTHLYDMPALLRKVQIRQGLSRKEVLTLLNGLSYIRAVNYFARLTSVPERIQGDLAAPLDTADWRYVYSILANATPTPEILGSTVLQTAS